MSWISDRFGAPDKNGHRRVLHKRPILKWGMTDEGWTEYREDLARFPNDPQAFVSGPRAKQKLIDLRKREGWVEGPSFSEMAKEHKPKEVNSQEFVKEAFERAASTGFRLDGEE